MSIQKLDTTCRFPYPIKEYAIRALWVVVHKSVWKVLWHKIPMLRSTLLRSFGARLHGNSLFRGSVSILRPHDLCIGKNVAIGPRSHIYNLANITIGDNTVISQDVYLCGGSHDYSKADLPLIRSAIEIGNGVWVCAGAFIGPGVKIADGAVIGARAVVMKDVEPFSVMAGNPAIKVRERICNE